MLYWSVAFFIVAIIAGVFGFFGIAAAAVSRLSQRRDRPRTGVGVWPSTQ